jgi:hypothetical protein
MIPKSFMGGIFPYFKKKKKTIVCILTLECNFIFLFSSVRVPGTTKEAFVANAI